MIDALVFSDLYRREHKNNYDDILPSEDVYDPKDPSYNPGFNMPGD